MKIRTNGDSIANEFLRLMGSKSSINKTASLNKKAKEEVSGGDTTVTVSSDVKDDSVSDEELADLLSGPSDEISDPVAEQIDESINSLSSDDAVDMKSASYISEKGIKVMRGLGEITASLRSKGENFAADVVEATAMSIGDDLRKEANEKKTVVSRLNKIASKLDKSGDKFAGDLVRTTINNIIKK
jgi:hypothetical protein